MTGIAALIEISLGIAFNPLTNLNLTHLYFVKLGSLTIVYYIKGILADFLKGMRYCEFSCIMGLFFNLNEECGR